MSRNYSDDFKRKIVELKRGGKSTAEIVAEYKLAKSTIHEWEKQYSNSGKFGIKENMTESEKPCARKINN